MTQVLHAGFGSHPAAIRRIFWPVLALFAAHAVLGIAGRSYPLLATVHSVAALGVGLRFAFRGDAYRTAVAASYITGAEVFWRMCRASLLWEYGKYAVVVILLTCMWRARLRVTVPSGLFFLLLVPSSVLTLQALGFDEARRQISFNLSGPFALAVAWSFFASVRLTREQLMSCYIALASAMATASAIAGSATYAAEISFGMYSNFEAAGGFGPNQVSALLGLGALVCVLTLFSAPGAGSAFQFLFGAIACIYATQSALTFSRAGLYQAAGGAIVAALYFIRTPAARLKVVTLALLLFLVASFVVLPFLESFTRGAIEQRFAETHLSARDYIAREQLAIFFENPLLGVGPGGGNMLLFRRTGVFAASHTEYTRILAEHGLLGAFALVALLLGAARRMWSGVPSYVKAHAGALLMWSLLMMSVNGMRIAAASLIFGLAMAQISPGRRAVVSPEKVVEHDELGTLRSATS